MSSAKYEGHASAGEKVRNRPDFLIAQTDIEQGDRDPVCNDELSGLIDGRDWTDDFGAGIFQDLVVPQRQKGIIFDHENTTPVQILGHEYLTYTAVPKEPAVPLLHIAFSSGDLQVRNSVFPRKRSILTISPITADSSNRLSRER